MSIIRTSTTFICPKCEKGSYNTVYIGQADVSDVELWECRGCNIQYTATPVVWMIEIVNNESS